MVVEVKPGSVALGDPAGVFAAVDFLLELQELASRTPASSNKRIRLKCTLSTPEMSQCDSKTTRDLKRPLWI
jgi:hypothetical protein